MLVKQLRRAILISIFFMLSGAFTSVLAENVAQAQQDAALMTEIFTDFDDQSVGVDVPVPAHAAQPHDDPLVLIQQRLMDYDALRQQQIGEQHFKLLSEEMQTLVKQALHNKEVVIHQLRLQSTLSCLSEAVQAQAGQTDALKQALTKFDAALCDNTFMALFFSNINTLPDDKSEIPAGWGKPDIKELLELLAKVSNKESATLCVILKKLYAADYRGAARACYNIHVASLDNLENALQEISTVLMQETAKIVPDSGPQHEALVYWTKQINKHLHTIVNIKKVAARATIDLSWILFALSHMYDAVEPYFIVNRQWGLQVVSQNGAPGRLFNKALLQDVCARSGIALAAMAQSHCDIAGEDITHLIIADARNIAKFVDPLDEGVGIIAVSGLFSKLKKYGSHLIAGAHAYYSPTKFGSRMSPLVQFSIRFGCAFAWYNLGNLKSFYNSGFTDNKALQANVYRSILRWGILECQAHVSGAIERAIYERIGVDRVYTVENATMGIISPQLLSECMDVLITNFLAEHHAVVENYIAKFDDLDVYRYHDSSYLLHMGNTYKASYPGDASFAGFSGYLNTNKCLYLKYRALYYAFGAVGRHWARKGAEANIEALSAGVCKVGMKIASYVLDEETLYVLGKSREAAIFLLQALAQDAMHTTGSQSRSGMINFMRSSGMLPVDLQDDKQINHGIVNVFVEYLFSAGIFDYRQATECLDEYKKHQDDLVEEFIPYFVDKIWHGALINVSGFIGRHIGYKAAEKFCFRSSPLSPLPVINSN